MVSVLLASGAAFLLALALTPVAIRVARRAGALDHPLLSRKSHATAVPRIGGVAIAVAFAGGVAAASASGSPIAGPRLLAIVGVGLLVAGIGLADDLRGLSPKAKLAAQLGAALLAWAAGLRIESVANPFGAPVALGALGRPFTVLFLVGAMNAMNLIDGMDGLAGGVAVIAAAAALAVARARGDLLLVVVAAAVIGAGLGFLRHNLAPASIFMGDSGSLFLGFVLAAGSIPDPAAASRGVDLVAPLVALGIPVLDTALAIARRLARGAPVFVGDREHLHHRLLARGLSPRRALDVLLGAALVHGVFAVALAGATGLRAAGLLAVLALLDLAALRALGFLGPGALSRLASERRRYAAVRSTLHSASLGLSRARSLDDVRAVLDGAASALGARQARLLLATDVARRQPRGGSRTRLGLRGERPGGGALEFRWSQPVSRLDRPTEVAAELLSARVGSAIRKLDAG